MSSETNLLAYKAIANFIIELDSIFGESQHSLRLYTKLITTTSISGDKVILKNIKYYPKKHYLHNFIVKQKKN